MFLRPGHFVAIMVAVVVHGFSLWWSHVVLSSFLSLSCFPVCFPARLHCSVFVFSFFWFTQAAVVTRGPLVFVFFSVVIMATRFSRVFPMAVVVVLFSELLRLLRKVTHETDIRPGPRRSIYEYCQQMRHTRQA